MTQGGSASRSAWRMRGMAMPASAAGRQSAPMTRSPVLGIAAAAVALHHHPLPRAESDDVGAVLEPPDSPVRLGDRSRQQLLDQSTLRLLGPHRPTLVRQPDRQRCHPSPSPALPTLTSQVTTDAWSTNPTFAYRPQAHPP